MNREEIQEALKIIREPIIVNCTEYKYFDQENYDKLVRTYENCRWFIDNWEQFEQNVEYQKKEIDRLNNIIDIILDFPFFKEECPLSFVFVEKELETKAQDVFYEDEWCEKNCDGNYKKCWLKYFDKLKELKEEK